MSHADVEATVVASWLVALESAAESRVRASLARWPDAEARSTVKGRLIVVSECGSHHLEEQSSGPTSWILFSH